MSRLAEGKVLRDREDWRQRARRSEEQEVANRKAVGAGNTKRRRKVVAGEVGGNLSHKGRYELFLKGGDDHAALHVTISRLSYPELVPIWRKDSERKETSNKE